MYIPDGCRGPLCGWYLEWSISKDWYWCGLYHSGMVTPVELDHTLCWWCERKFNDPTDNRPHSPHARERKVLAIRKNRLLPIRASDEIVWKISELLVSKWAP